MLIREEVEKAVHLQGRSYELLKWLEKALKDGFISPEAAGNYGTSEDAAYAWLDRHYLNLPNSARPERSDLRAFSNFFSTYLECTFDLDPVAKERLYSPRAHCFCCICSWMVQKPHLRPKKITSSDKKIAEKMKRIFLRRLAEAQEIPFTETILEEMLQDPDLRESIALCTYAANLLQRLEGVGFGAASLELWRTFAWTPQNSPKKNFILTTDAIMKAQDLLSEHLANN